MTHTLTNKVPVHKLSNGDKVVNHTPETEDKTLMSFAANLRAVCVDMIPFFDLSTAKGRKLPSVSFGWTDNDPNQYKKHRVFVCGKMKRPSLITGAHHNMKNRSLLRIATLALQVVEYMNRDAEYKTPEMKGSAPYTASFFHKEFANYMGYKDEPHNKLSKFFTFHGISIILNGKVAIHEDSGNPTEVNNDQTYSMNTKIPVYDNMWKCKSFSNILKKMGVKRQDSKATLSVSIMIYKKKCVTDFVKRWDTVSTTGRSTADNPIQRYLFDLLSTVNCEHNYSRIFHDTEVRRQMMMDASQSTHKQPCFFGKTYRSPESVDRTAYLTSLFDEIVCFGADTGTHFTKADIIGTALFLGSETNGTLLMMGCMELMRKEGMSARFKKELKHHSMYSIWGRAQKGLFNI